jgi:hypothetical protein
VFTSENAMKIHLEGDKGKAACHRCGDVVRTTFVRRDVPFSDGSGSASNILVGACDVCGDTVSIPAQSTPAIRRARKAASAALEASLPAVYVDVLDCAVHTIDHQASTDFRRVLLTYFVHKAAHDARAASRLKKSHERALARFPEQRGSARRRLSMKVPQRLNDELRLLQERTSLNTTELLKSVVVDIQDTVLDKPKSAVIDELRALSAIAA